MFRRECEEWYTKTRVYCADLTADLSCDEIMTISRAHPEFLAWEQQADAAALAGNVSACKAMLHEYMKGWKQAVAALRASHQLTFPE